MKSRRPPRSTVNRVLFWILALPLMLACAAVAPLAISEWTLARVLFAVVWVLVCASFTIALYLSAYHSGPAVPSGLRMAQATRGIAALMVWPLFAGAQLWSRGVLWRPVAVLLFALGIVTFPLNAIFQILHNSYTRMLHDDLGTTILIRSDGIELARAGHPARPLQWRELASIHVKLGRRFEEAGTTIRDVPSYEIVLQSGETLVADFVDEQQLLAACQERGIEVRV